MLFAPLACKLPLEKYEETRDMWDTFINVTVYSGDEALAQEAINAAFTRMEEIGNVASTFDENSQAFKLNRDGYLDNPSPNLVELVKQSIEYSELTNGSFDITVQPLLDLWAGGLWKENPETQQKRIDEVLELIGSDKIEVTSSRISLKAEGMKITLGGITKGYAADEALKVINKMGIKHALVAVGGDVRPLGTKPDGELWQITLVNPDNPQESLATFKFAQKSISTSGNYERYFSPDKEVHHIINPASGYSASECISVTIIAESGVQADALATGVFVMGPDAGMKLVESLKNVEAFIVDSERVIHRSSGIDKYLVEVQRGEEK